MAAICKVPTGKATFAGSRCFLLLSYDMGKNVSGKHTHKNGKLLFLLYIIMAHVVYSKGKHIDQ